MAQTRDSEDQRKDAGRFDVDDLKAREPLGQLRHWMEEAEQVQGVRNAHVMTIATATKEGIPSARTVLMGKIDKRGVTFLTCRDSRKAKELVENPHCCLVFHWLQMNRSVQVEGTAELVPEVSEAEFARFPRGLQIACNARTMSNVIPNREVLLQKHREATSKYSDESKPVPKAPSWECYRVVPTVVEFYLGHSDFFSDRLRFRRPRPEEVIDRQLTREMEDGWVLERLS